MATHSTNAILLIYTGGTIGMLENPLTGVLEPLDFAYLQEQLPELGTLGCHIAVEALPQPIDSSSVSAEVWVDIARIVEREYDHYDGFVVLHGTDTMAYSASALSFMLRNLGKPVIFTGSQLPIGRMRTDGKENLISAIEIASARTEDDQPRVPEVCIFFQNTLMRGNRAMKVSVDQFQAFKSHNYPRLAHAGIDIRYNDYFIHHPAEGSQFKIYTQLSSEVIVLKLFPCITSLQVNAILQAPGVRGVVMETYGSGNGPKEGWFYEALESALARGIVIVNITQCSTGAVDMRRYETGVRLHTMGIIDGRDMTTEAAITKLMVLLGQDLPSSKVAERMALPTRGEMSLEPEGDDKLCWEMLQYHTEGDAPTY